MSQGEGGAKVSAEVSSSPPKEEAPKEEVPKEATASNPQDKELKGRRAFLQFAVGDDVDPDAAQAALAAAAAADPNKPKRRKTNHVGQPTTVIPTDGPAINQAGPSADKIPVVLPIPTATAFGTVPAAAMGVLECIPTTPVIVPNNPANVTMVPVQPQPHPAKISKALVSTEKVGTHCSHGRRRSRCKECGGGAICQHGRQRSQCKDCGGSSICTHGRRRCECKDCGGSSICQHGRRRSRCKQCGGSSICTHGRRKERCKECGGSEFCTHGRRKSQCKECGPKKVQALAGPPVALAIAAAPIAPAPTDTPLVLAAVTTELIQPAPGQANPPLPIITTKFAGVIVPTQAPTITNEVVVPMVAEAVPMASYLAVQADVAD